MTGGLLTVSEVADRYGVTERTVRNWTHLGLLTAYRFGEAFRFDPDELPENKPGR
jgi:excisionase family DNA binding protein